MGLSYSARAPRPRAAATTLHPVTGMAVASRSVERRRPRLDPSEVPVELRQQLLFLRSSLRWIIAATLIAAVVALGVSLALPKSYESQVVLLVGGVSGSSSAGDLNALQVSQRLSQTYAQIAVSRQVANRVIAELGLNTDFEHLLSHVRAEAPVDSTLLTISVSRPRSDAGRQNRQCLRDGHDREPDHAVRAVHGGPGPHRAGDDRRPERDLRRRDTGRQAAEARRSRPMRIWGVSVRCRGRWRRSVRPSPRCSA